MEDSKTLLWYSKFPWVCERNSSKNVDNLGTRPQKGSSALTANVSVCGMDKLWDAGGAMSNFGTGQC